MQIRTKNLIHKYMEGTPFENTALQGVSIDIPEGKITGIVGETGCGKTTLIHHFNGILKPTSGNVFVDGKDINDRRTDLKAVRQSIGMVFQYPESQLFEETVFDEVAYAPRNQGLSKDEVKERVKYALEIVDMDFESYGKRHPLSLSGGEMRRVAMAGILSMKPKALVLDEPVAGLDPGGRDKMWQKILDFNKNLGMTVVAVSHSMEDMARFADFLILMSGGKAIFQGAPTELFTKVSDIESFGITVPEYTLLMKYLRAKGFLVKEAIFTREEAKKEILRLAGK